MMDSLYFVNAQLKMGAKYLNKQFRFQEFSYIFQQTNVVSCVNISQGWEKTEVELIHLPTEYKKLTRQRSKLPIHYMNLNTVVKLRRTYQIKMNLRETATRLLLLTQADI